MPPPREWVLPAPIAPESERALGEFDRLPRLILARRGLVQPAAVADFLDRRYSQDTDPEQMLGMTQAVDRVQAARDAREKVVVYGDYDADGVTAAVLLCQSLRAAGLEADWYIPDRFDEGYGLNAAALAELSRGGASLVITVDCGIRSIAEAALAGRLGLDLIITDHHLPGPQLPSAIALLDPNQPQDRYPFKGLAGVGIAFKYAQAIFQRLGGVDPQELLDLVAVGTVADLAPLVGENRSLVHGGLERLNMTRRPGLRALIDACGLQLGKLTASSIAFGLAPRLNAAGRMESARMAMELLLAQGADEAAPLAERLNLLNQRRQRTTQRNVEIAMGLIQAEPEPPYALLAMDQRFHEGVIGLAASRLAEAFFRPVLLLVPEGELAKGSARSIPGFNITSALEACSDLLVRFGGHAQAAGFALEAGNFEALAARLEREAARAFREADLRPKLELEAVVEFRELDAKLMQFLDQLEPCGQDNPSPCLAAMGVEVLAKRAVGSEGRHLKLTLRQAGVIFDAIAFRQGELTPQLPEVIDVAFRFERNEFRGVTSFQLNVEAIQASNQVAWY